MAFGDLGWILIHAYILFELDLFGFILNESSTFDVVMYGFALFRWIEVN